MTKLINQTQNGLKILNCTIIDMRSVKPKTLYTFFGILDNIIANFLKHFIIWNIESTKIYFQDLNLLARGYYSSNIAEKVIKNLLLSKMAVAKTL